MLAPNTSVDIPGAVPLLNSVEDDRVRRSLRRQSLREAARFLRRASSRRLMREPSMLVRETAAEQIEERQTDWAYSKPVVIIDLMWNFAFVVVSAVVLVLSVDESPTQSLRLWIVGYALQCVVHMVGVWFEYRSRRGQRWAGDGESEEGSGSSGVSRRENGSRYVTLAQLTDEELSARGKAKMLESANTIFSFIWWILGFYWVSIGGQVLAADSPKLYWLCVVFLSFEVFFVGFCIALACVIGIAVCCCLPCILAVLYAVRDQEGASKEDLELIPKYKFRRTGDVDKINDEIQGRCGGVMTECGTDTPIEHDLSPEDAECCICLTTYDDGAELRELPCSHHFHCNCIDKWLYINATCPLCKYNVVKNNNRSVEEV